MYRRLSTGANQSRLSQLTSPIIGPLLEGLVTMDLARQLTWADEEIRLFHYRTKDKVEVDAILETDDGRVAGVEVKASATVTGKDFNGLRHLHAQAGTPSPLGWCSTPAANHFPHNILRTLRCYLGAPCARQAGSFRPPWASRSDVVAL